MIFYLQFKTKKYRLLKEINSQDETKLNEIWNGICNSFSHYNPVTISENEFHKNIYLQNRGWGINAREKIQWQIHLGQKKKIIPLYLWWCIPPTNFIDPSMNRKKQRKKALYWRLCATVSPTNLCCTLRRNESRSFLAANHHLHIRDLQAAVAAASTKCMSSLINESSAFDRYNSVNYLHLPPWHQRGARAN